MNFLKGAGVVFTLVWLTAVPVPRQQSSRETSIYFRERFETNPLTYGFANRFPQGQWKLEHLPSGGWDGGGAAHVVMLANTEQYRLGWETGSLGKSWRIGEGVYLRLRLRYDDDFRWDGEVNNKFLLMGRTRTKPNSRVIVFMNQPHDSYGCTLGMRDTSQPRESYFPWAVPGHYGLRNRSFEEPSIRGLYGSLAPHVNIGWDCGPPALQTFGNHPNPPVPGPNSAPPANGWYHVQIYAQSGGPGEGAFKTWVNNNDVRSPTAQRIGLDEGLGVTDWDRGVVVGGYVGPRIARNLGYRIDDFEVGGEFDPAWYPGRK